jgi:Peptidase U49
MNRIDVSKAADILIRAAAPERVDELSKSWGTGPDRVHLVDEGVFDIKEVFGLIQVTEITLRQIWLLSFAAWRAIQAYGGLFWYLNLARQPFERDVIAALHGQAEADAAFDALLANARAGNLDKFEWPADVPEPTPENIFNNRHDEAAFNLACIAGAYIFLHEIRHARFSKEGGRPVDPRAEELECDSFARRFLLEKVDAYARDNGKAIEDVRAKRALAIAVAKTVIMEVQEHWESTATHPAVGVRVRSFLEDVAQPVREWFWLCSASFFAAICRTRGRLPQRIDFASARDLALALANCL